MHNISLEAITIDSPPSLVFADKGISMSVLRLDKIHPLVSGNKWFKLKYYIEDAIRQGKKNIITFGGAYSNHIIATAAACHIYGLSSTGIIRGEETTALSPTLQQARELGMQLVFVSREQYSRKEIPAPYNSNDYLVQEGGYGIPGAKGAADIGSYIDPSFTHIACAVGTGTMMAGLINASLPSQSVIGISSMKNNTALEEAVHTLLKEEKTFRIFHDYHFGGYAKHNKQLLQFMNEFYSKTGIPTDFVYTAKLFYGVTDLIHKNFFPAGSKILLVHSGGLQGNRGLGEQGGFRTE
jgi:1-aminocyclopropane-1-carboxylate deaminase